MINFFKAHSDQIPQEFISRIVKDVKNHTQDAEQSDDITSLILNSD